MLKRLTSDDRVLFGLHRDVLICIGVGQETENTFHTWERHLRRHVREHPSGIGVLFIVQHPDKPPPGHREGMLRLMDIAKGHLQGAAVVLQATGFAGATQRSIASLLIGLAGLTRTARVFSRTDEAAPWLAMRMREAVDATAIIESVEEMERAVEELKTTGRLSGWGSIPAP